MPIPPSVTKMKNGNVEFTSNVDRVNYTFQELGSSKTKKLGLLKETVQDNIPKIIEIQSKYLSGLESESKALSMINEQEYKGGADG